ncbi:hypothetical protein ACEXQD_08735 [Herbiconiux sp. P15]|uniref:hypothetical protein n=1 Tax=Herbiconiux liukaitaii TaxID=3342799 RepID=UPI0035B85E13
MKRVVEWYWRRGWSSRDALGSAIVCAVNAAAVLVLWFFVRDYGREWAVAAVVVAVAASALSALMFAVSGRIRSREKATSETD